MTRRWSCQRHISLKHQGIGAVVPEIEYIIGRVNGLYAQPSVQSGFKQNPIKELTVFDRAQDELIIEFYREFAKKAVQNIFQLRSPSSPTSYAEPVDLLSSGGTLFGMKAFVCPKCYSIKPLLLFYSTDEKPGRSEVRPACSNRPEFFSRLNMTYEEYASLMSKGFPEFLKGCVNVWTNRKPVILAFEVAEPEQNQNTIEFVWIDPGGQELGITLDYTEKKCINLNRSGIGPWARRSIETGSADVNDDELLQFLQTTTGATFGFFRGGNKPNDRVYLLAIARSVNEDADNLLQALGPFDVTFPETG